MIVTIRGTNGSGKSTIVRKFLQSCSTVEVFGILGPRRPEAYKVQLTGKSLYILGPYQTPTGGLDALGISVPDTIKMIERYRKLGHVLFEGVVISTTFGELGYWFAENPKDVIVAFMSTSLDDCLQGISDRGGSKWEHVAAKHKTIQKVQETMRLAHIRTESISRNNGFEKIKSWLK